MSNHGFSIVNTWTGNTGSGTASYDTYERSHEFSAPSKPTIPGSASPEYRGDAARYNPEEMLLGAVSACHMLWYLHLCAENGVVVSSYSDTATGKLHMNPNGSGEFKSITLCPVVELLPGSDAKLASALHDDAGRMCFIARSLRCDVQYRPQISVKK
jgi:organic hydroperoxide reductase OsmC/OhrA